MRQCLFCKNAANSKEDLVPRWILARVNVQQQFRRQIGLTVLKWTDNLDIKIKSVCKSCNEGWMSALEVANKPIIGPLINDLSLPLNSSEQRLITIWAAKTSMILDSAKKQGRFYEKSECEELRLTSTIPIGTTVWIGRYFGRSLHTGSRNFVIQNRGGDVGKGFTVTFLLAHLVIQVLTIRIFSEYEDRRVRVDPYPANWDKALFRMWPSQRSSVQWPPLLSFNTESFAALEGRWAAGTSKMSS
jgi:hypothetical protein